MEREILNNILYKTNLIDAVAINEIEKAVLNLYFNQNKTTAEVSDSLVISNERTQEILHKIVSKLLFTIKSLQYKAEKTERLEKVNDQLLNENRYLLTGDEKYKPKEPPTVNEDEKALADMQFSARAKSVLRELNIRTLSQLKQSSIDDLSKLRGGGEKTIQEITSKLEQQGFYMP